MIRAIANAIRAAWLALSAIVGAFWNTLRYLLAPPAADDDVPPAPDDDEVIQQEAAAEEMTPRPKPTARPGPGYSLAADVVDFCGSRLFAADPEAVMPPTAWPRELRAWAGSLDRSECGSALSAGTIGIFNHLAGGRQIAGLRPLMPTAPKRTPAPPALDHDLQPALAYTP